MKIKDYKAAARRLLRGKYGILIASQFVQYMVSYTVLTVAMIIFGSAFAFFTTDNEVMKVVTAILLAVSIILAVLVSLFMTLGLNKQYLNMCRRGYVTFSDLFYAFRPGAHPMRYVWVSLCMGLMVGIPGLLLIFLAVLGSELAFGSGTVGMVAGNLLFYAWTIYICVRYAFASFIVIDKPEKTVMEALKRSSRLTRKRRLKLIWLFAISFLPWCIPLVLTLGLAALWITPYIYTTIFLFYLRAEQEEYPEESYGSASTEDKEVTQ